MGGPQEHGPAANYKAPLDSEVNDIIHYILPIIFHSERSCVGVSSVSH